MGQDHIGVAFGGLYELLVQGAHGFQVFVDHALGGAVLWATNAFDRSSSRPESAPQSPLARWTLVPRPRNIDT